MCSPARATPASVAAIALSLQGARAVVVASRVLPGGRFWPYWEGAPRRNIAEPASACFTMHRRG
jgi:hypothetical protein